MRRPEKWNYFYLYVPLDVFSRYTVAWMIAPRESGNLARKMADLGVTKSHSRPHVSNDNP